MTAPGGGNSRRRPDSGSAPGVSGDTAKRGGARLWAAEGSRAKTWAEDREPRGRGRWRREPGCRRRGRPRRRRRACWSKPNAQASRPPQLVPVFQAMLGGSDARGKGWVRMSATSRAAGSPGGCEQIREPSLQQRERAWCPGRRGRRRARPFLAHRQSGAAERQRQRRGRRPAVGAAGRLEPGGAIRRKTERPQAVEQRRLRAG